MNRRQVMTAIGAITLMSLPFAQARFRPSRVNINELIAKLIVSDAAVGRVERIVPTDAPTTDIWEGDIITLPDGREFEFVRELI